MNLIAKVKSTEYFVPSFVLVMYRVIAGPCDLTATNLKMGISREGIHLFIVSVKFVGLTSTEIFKIISYLKLSSLIRYAPANAQWEFLRLCVTVKFKC